MRACVFCQKPMGPPLIVWGATFYSCPCMPPTYILNLDVFDCVTATLVRVNHDPGDEDRS